MISSFWRDTLTVYTPSNNGSVTTWSRHVYDRCFFKSTKASAYSDNQSFNGCKVTARIPDKVNAVIGSIVVKGRVVDKIPDNTSGNELLGKYPQTAFRVNYISENTAFVPPHTRLGGD